MLFVSELQGDVDGGFVDSRGWSTKPFVFLPYLCNRKSEEMRLVPEKDSEEMALVGVITF